MSLAGQLQTTGKDIIYFVDTNDNYAVSAEDCNGFHISSHILDGIRDHYQYTA